MEKMSNSRIAVLPGSFDPVTMGHFDVICTSSEMFDEIYAAVCVNTEKKGIFTPEQRVGFISHACRDIKNIHVEICCGLMSDYMAERGIKYIVKGVRNGTDFDYEYNLSQIMRTFDENCETVILPSKNEYQHISSTYVRELLKYESRLLDAAVPPETAGLMRQCYKSNQIKFE